MRSKHGCAGMTEMTHQMHLDHGPFQKIKTGVKTIELRLNDEKRRRIRVGDRILFTDSSDGADSVAAEVVALHPFKDFRELYAHLSLETCGYTTAEAVRNARPEDMLAYYSMEQQRTYGVLGIEIRLLPET